MDVSFDDTEMFVLDLSDKPDDYAREPTRISIPTATMTSSTATLTSTLAFGPANPPNLRPNNLLMGMLTNTSTTTSNNVSTATTTTTTNYNFKPYQKYFQSNPLYEPILNLHCVVQIIMIDQSGLASSTSVSDQTNEFSIEIPATTKFCHLTNVVLTKMGYGNYYINNSRSFLLLKNCNPINTENVPRSSTDTVGDILGALVPYVSFKIEVYLENVNKYADIKDKLLQFFLLNSCNTLLRSDCPLSKPFLNKLVTTTLSLDEEPDEETRRKFYLWWYQQTVFLKTFLFETSKRLSYSENFDKRWSSVQFMPPEVIYEWDAQEEPAVTEIEMQETVKSRARTTFDTRFELPKLRKWFEQDNYPSRQKIEEYVRELNQSESRKNGRPLDVNNILYWFKNMRSSRSRGNSQPKPSANNDNARNSNLMDFEISGPPTANRRGSTNVPTRNNSCCSNMSCLLSGIGSNQNNELANNLMTNQMVDCVLAAEAKKELERNSRNNLAMGNYLNYGTVGRYDKKFPCYFQSMYDNGCGNGSGMCAGVSGGVGIFPGNSGIGRRSVGLQQSSNFSSPASDRFLMSGCNSGLATPMMTSFSADSFPLNFSMEMAEERKKRNRTFIDPYTEIPKLDAWFQVCSHPTYTDLTKFTDELNNMPYRLRYPKLDMKNIQMWFKNKRAKDRRNVLSNANTPK